MILYLVHGWGFDGSIWRELIRALPDFEVAVADLGYFGATPTPAPDRPFIAVTHSYGTMHVLAQDSPQCLGLVAINGFACFSQRGSFAGTSPRVLDRMLAQFRRDRRAVLAQFRERCGLSGAVPEFDAERLERDLIELRDGDYRQRLRQSGLPVRGIHGLADPILTNSCTTAYLGQSAHVSCIAEAGHMLPLSHPDACAAEVRALAGERV